MMPTPVSRLIASVAIIAAVATGCGDDDAADTDPTTTTAPSTTTSSSR